MKKLLLLALCTASISAYALPTYEPFTEFTSALASSPTNLTVMTTNGVSLGTNANSAISNCLDLATGGYTAPSGEQWGSLNFSGTGTQPLRGLDIAIISNANIFTSANLSSLLPSVFPGLPAAGQAITNIVENPAQPALWASTNFAESNYVGNSAVLKFASDITRPTNGTKTLYVSYLFAVAQIGAAGPNNDGRYLDYVASTNLAEGPGSGGAFLTWSAMFNTFNTTSNKYCGQGVLQDGSSLYVGACDSSTGKDFTSSPFVEAVNTTPMFVVGAYLFNSSGKDTNYVWVNPATSGFGGATPPSSPISATTMAFNMSDIGGLVIEDRVGSGASGGVGTNYIANLLIGSTWSYVTGGPEFTSQPAASTSVVLGGSALLNATATAAAQSVSYQWQKVTGGTTNNLMDGSGMAGGTATVSGSGTASLSLSGISTGDLGSYQCLATASGTGFSLASSQDAVVSDPLITSQPQNATVNYGAQATFSTSITTAKPTLTYQWSNSIAPLTNGLQADGSTVGGASGTISGGANVLTLTLSNLSYLDEGAYSLYATNNVDNSVVTAPVSLTVNDPYIITQPANPAVAASGNATFTVVAAGSPTITYQWYENGIQLVNGNSTATGSAIVGGATSATLTLTGVQDADNGSYKCIISGSASLQSTTTTAAVLTVQDPLTVVTAPVSRAERVGDHLAFTVKVIGGGPSFQWYFGSSPISGATTTALVLTNIQTGSNGTYSIVVSNVATLPVTNSATLTVINSAFLNLQQSNVVVVRLGDGVQTLSSTTGNTIYLDQYTTNGQYVATVQIPDENTGQAYGTGSSASVFGSPALLVAGAGTDAGYEGFLTTSGSNQEYLDLAGYCQQYPFSGGNLNATGSNFRGLATINAFGFYTLAYTNVGLYNGGSALMHSMVTLDGNSFWAAGEAGSVGGIKYVNKATGGAYANGNGIPTLTSSTNGPRLVQIVSNNLVFSDQAGSSGAGIYGYVGLPEPLPDTVGLLINEGGQPNDFAFSPDGRTVYIADSQSFAGTNSQSGGIQRWDTNTAGSGWVYSYTLAAEPTDLLGAQSLTVDFSAATTWGPGVTGAVLYTTSASASTNTLCQIVDNGAGSVPAVITTASPNQVLRGVRFGPAAVPVAIVTQPSGGSAFLGNNFTFTVNATGSGPLYYQWLQYGTNITGATSSSLTLTNLTFANAGSYVVTISNLVPSNVRSIRTGLAVSTGVPTFTVPSYVETVGDHLSFAPAVSGSQPFFYSWALNGTNISTNSVITLTNIQFTNAGTYTLVISNSYGVATNSGSLTVTASPPPLSSTNLVVARIGDGAQALSEATGNTIYLDQYTATGTYVSTIQIPDEAAGFPYGTGGSSSASMPFGSPALLIAGADGNEIDAAFEGFLSLSADGQSLNFAGYCDAYPFTGADMTVGALGGNNWRGIGNVDASGYYTLVYTNTGLYSGGNHQIHGAATSDGTNYWTTGEAGSGNGMKYATPGFEPASGLGIPGIAGSFYGTRAVQIVAGNVVFSDIGNPGQALSVIGIWYVPGLTGTSQTGQATATLLIPETNSPMDFSFSPDGKTVYIADNGTFGGTNVPMGGIQRWDTNTVGGGYTYSYTLPTEASSTVGARGLAVLYPTNIPSWGAGVIGAVLYATTAEASGNSLIQILDNGSGAVVVPLVTTSANEMLAGLKFGPAAANVVVASSPTNESVSAGGSATFSVGLSGRDGPFFYQWKFDGTNILGATNSSYTINNVQATNTGTYSVVVSNLISSTNASATLGFGQPPTFTSTRFLGIGTGLQLNFTGPAGVNYSIWSTSDVTQAPIQSTWTRLTGGTFSGGADTYVDPSGGSNPRQYYIISVP